MDAKKTGELIARRRKEQGLSQGELAERIHVTDKAVSKWETGRGMPGIDSLEPLAEVSGMFFHKVPDLPGDHRPPVLCDKHDVVSQKIYGVGTFPVFHKASFKCYTSCIFNVFMV